MKKLTIELIVQKCKTDNLQKIKKLDVWSSDLEDVTIIKELPALEICSLSLNKIKQLSFFQSSHNLTELYLRKNLISDLFEIRCLQNCQKLKVLWLWDNPIAQHPLYRSFIVKTLPNLVKLDNQPVSMEERMEVQKMTISEQDIVRGNNKVSQALQMQNNNSLAGQQQNSSSMQGMIANSHSASNRVRSVNSQPRNNEGQLISERSGLAPLNPAHNASHQVHTTASNGQLINASNHAAVTATGSQQSNNYRNENILCAVLALLKELDESGLELVKRDIDRKLQNKKQGKQ